ncbi:hypothetical protein SY88_15515 [Clostridiales bacterium PH28_bin88]|nr:hypothetical protein SY88_15515 [Clostridiales bacterium PH28_bin88]
MSVGDKVIASVQSRVARYSLAGFAVVTGAHLLVDAYVTMLTPLMPLLSARLGFSMALAGIAVSTVSVLSAWTQPFLGIVLDRYNRGWVLPLSLVWVGGWFSAIGFAPNYSMLVVMACIGGLGSAVFHPLGSVVATASAGPKKGLLMSLYITAGNLGIALAPLVTIPLATGAGGLPSLLVLVLPGLMMAGVMWLYRPEGNPFIRQKVGLRPNVQPVPTKVIGEGPRKFGTAYALLVLNSLMVLKGWVSRAMAVYLPFYYTSLGYDYLFTGKVLAAFLLAGAIGGLCGGLFSDSIDRRRGITAANFISAVTLVAFFHTTGVPAVILLLITNFFIESTYPATVVLGQELLASRAVLASGMMFGLSFGMGGVSAAVTGLLAETWPLESVLESYTWLLIIAGVLSILIPCTVSAKRA